MAENNSSTSPSSSDNTPDHDSSWWSASLYNQSASFVYSPSYTAPVLDLLGAKSGERILDFGCGSGEVTLQIAQTVGPHGLVVGVDQSKSMIDKARKSGLEHAFVSNVQRLELPPEFKLLREDANFDAVFSNACLHWCKQDPKGVLDSAKRVLKPGGRFVGEMGGFMNCIGIRSALHLVLDRRGYDAVALDPWYYPSVNEYQQLLISAGFEPTHVSLNARITPLPQGLTPWLRLFVRNSFLQGFDDAEAEDVIQEVASRCAVDCMDGDGRWAMIYMRLRFAAVRH